MICPGCKAEMSKSYHFKKCNPEKLDKDSYREYVVSWNYKNLIQSHGIKIKSLYENGYSVNELSSLYEVNWGHMVIILKNLGLEKRNLSESASTSRRKQKIEYSCLEKYGATNVLSKDTPGYHKRNDTVLKRYGVTNVRMLESTKDKIDNTMVNLYGKKRICKSPGYKFKINKQNKLESKIAEILTRLNISYKYSHFVCRKQFDFLITGTKILLEIQGDFWHANPNLFQATDILNYPGGKIEAQIIWAKDKEKKNLVESYGYKIIEIWESDIKTKSDEEIANYLIDIITS
jgi:G:T-mismatch repair DNA endonuclease (very short patch repair protein)